MSYDTVKDNLVLIMNTLGYKEANDPTEFEDVSALAKNLFIVNAQSGELSSEGETLVDRFYDDQQWEIKLAFNKSEHNEVINRDKMHRKRVAIITAIDNTTNWLGSVRIQKYQSWGVEELENYFLLTITVQIIDTIIY